MTVFQSALPMSIVNVGGTQCLDFLHRMFTADIKKLPLGGAMPAGWCRADGKMAANFLVVRDAPQDVSIVLPEEMAASFAKRLRMYVLRSDVTIAEDLRREVWGFWGRDPLSPVPQAMWATWRPAGAIFVKLPGAPGGPERWLGLCERTPKFPEGKLSDWMVEQALAGAALLGPETSGLVYPQSVGLDSLGGVSFTKGCYPGQEIVTALHHRAKSPHRPAAGFANGPCKPGKDILRVSDGAPCGRVLACAPAGEGRFAVVVEASVKDIEEGLKLPSGAALSVAVPAWLKP